MDVDKLIEQSSLSVHQRQSLRLLRLCTLGKMRYDPIEPEQVKDRIIFMSMYNDIAWDEKGNQETFENHSQTVANYARKFLRGHWSFLRLGSEKKWCGTCTGRPDGSWDKTAEPMMLNFSGSGHPIFRASSAFERGELRSKGGGKKSIHFNGGNENIELFLRTVISANQLSLYRAAADLWNELSGNLKASGKPEAPAYQDKKGNSHWSFHHRNSCQ